MKLIFFIIAVCLISIRIYFSWSGHDRREENKGNISIRSETFDEQIEWLGEVELNEAETSIQRISPGGYVKYHRNDTQFVAESNVKGFIAYSFPGMQALTDSGRTLIVQQATREMVGYGFNSRKRMEQIFKKGGYPALVEQLRNLKIDNLQNMYMNRILQADSLPPASLITLAHELRRLGNGDNQADLLSKFSRHQLDSPEVRLAFFQTIDSMDIDIYKEKVLQRLIQQGSLSAPVIDHILYTTGQLKVDVEKIDLLDSFIDAVVLSEQQWVQLMSLAGALNTDTDKANLLVHIAHKMPTRDSLKAQYLLVAKTIGSDAEYGKVMRAAN